MWKCLELLITAGGENVAPVAIEMAVKEQLPCISNCIVIGDQRKFLSLLITLQVLSSFYYISLVLTPGGHLVF